MAANKTTTLANGVKIQKGRRHTSLILGTCRLTVSGGGWKGTGGVPNDVFDSFRKWCLTFSIEDGISYEEHLAKWATKTLPTLWSDWNVEPPTPTLGQKVTQDFGNRRGAWSGKLEGEVIALPKRKGGRYNVQFPAGLLAMTAVEIAQ